MPDHSPMLTRKLVENIGDTCWVVCCDLAGSMLTDWMRGWGRAGCTTCSSIALPECRCVCFGDGCDSCACAEECNEGVEVMEESVCEADEHATAFTTEKALGCTNGCVAEGVLLSEVPRKGCWLLGCAQVECAVPWCCARALLNALAVIVLLLVPAGAVPLSCTHIVVASLVCPCCAATTCCCSCCAAAATAAAFGDVTSCAFTRRFVATSNWLAVSAVFSAAAAAVAAV